MKNVDRLKEMLASFERRIDADIRGLKTAVEEERSARTAEVRRVSERLKSAQAEGLDVTVLGLVWLVLGLILATFSGELAGV